MMDDDAGNNLFFEWQKKFFDTKVMINMDGVSELALSINNY